MAESLYATPDGFDTGSDQIITASTPTCPETGRCPVCARKRAGAQFAVRLLFSADL